MSTTPENLRSLLLRQAQTLAQGTDLFAGQQAIGAASGIDHPQVIAANLIFENRIRPARRAEIALQVIHGQVNAMMLEGVGVGPRGQYATLTQGTN
jgi:hypothetical protein